MKSEESANNLLYRNLQDNEIKKLKSEIDCLSNHLILQEKSKA